MLTITNVVRSVSLRSSMPSLTAFANSRSAVEHTRIGTSRAPLHQRALDARIVGRGRGALVLPRADGVEREVDRDPVEPRERSAPSVEAIQRPVGAHEGVLRHVLGFRGCRAAGGQPAGRCASGSAGPGHRTPSHRPSGRRPPTRDRSCRAFRSALVEGAVPCQVGQSLPRPVTIVHHCQVGQSRRSAALGSLRRSASPGVNSRDFQGFPARSRADPCGAFCTAPGVRGLADASRLAPSSTLSTLDSPALPSRAQACSLRRGSGSLAQAPEFRTGKASAAPMQNENGNGTEPGLVTDAVRDLEKELQAQGGRRWLRRLSVLAVLAGSWAVWSCGDARRGRRRRRASRRRRSRRATSSNRSSPPAPSSR